jgi:hypothetical protein
MKFDIHQKQEKEVYKLKYKYENANSEVKTININDLDKNDPLRIYYEKMAKGMKPYQKPTY